MYVKHKLLFSPVKIVIDPPQISTQGFSSVLWTEKSIIVYYKCRQIYTSESFSFFVFFVIIQSIYMV